MKTLFNRWFIAFILIWLCLFICRKSHYPVPYLNDYLGDALAIPVIANLGLWFKRILIIKNDYYVLSAKQVAFIVIYVSLVFEGLLPLTSKIYTADYKDLLLYVLGGIFFYKIMNKPLAITRYNDGYKFKIGRS